MILLPSIHVPLNPNEQPYFNEVAQITWSLNKVKYAEKHNYLAIGKSNGFYGTPIGFEKILFLYDLLNGIPQCSWAWWTGCDTLITNFKTTVESKIQDSLKINPNAHIIMSGDCNFPINSDSILIKNSEQSKSWLRFILDNYEVYSRKKYVEQECMIDFLWKFKDIIQIMPQYFMNSYDELSADSEKVKYDVTGERGNWEQGDWLLHLAGISWENRARLVKEYSTKISY